MWDRITSADVERAKAALNEKRAEVLSRHADEIKGLDAQLRDIESCEPVKKLSRTQSALLIATLSGFCWIVLSGIAIALQAWA